MSFFYFTKMDLMLKPPPISSEFITYPPFNEKFSIIYPTHLLRKNYFAKILDNIAYGQSQHLDAIFIYWIDKNPSNMPPPLSEYVNESSVKVRIEIINSEKRLFTDRFVKPKNLTTRTVFSSDDDIRISGEYLDQLFEMYLSNHFRDFMFGSMVRSCNDGRYGRSSRRFNMVLTDACFLDASMLDLYQLPRYEKARKWVNDRFNGEDILMNFVVQENFQTPPIAFNFDKGMAPNALSYRRSHNNQRHEACSFFKSFFGNEITAMHPSTFYYKNINNYLQNISFYYSLI